MPKVIADEGVGGPQLVTPRHRRAPLTRRPYLGLPFEPSHALRIYCGSEAKNAPFCWQKCSPGSSEDVGSGFSFWFYCGAERRPRERVHLHVHRTHRDCVNGSLCAAVKNRIRRARWLFIYSFAIWKVVARRDSRPDWFGLQSAPWICLARWHLGRSRSMRDIR